MDKIELLKKQIEEYCMTLYNPEGKNVKLYSMKYDPNSATPNYIILDYGDFKVKIHPPHDGEVFVIDHKDYILNESDRELVKDVKDNRSKIFDIVRRADDRPVCLFSTAPAFIYNRIDVEPKHIL